MELGLKGKVVAVTGGSEGIGRATVQRFVAEGSKVAFCARRKEPLEQFAAELRKAGGDVMCMTADASKAGELEAFIEATVKHFGRIDVVVNNAGGTAPRPFLDTTPGYLERSFHFNVTTAFVLTKAAVPHMLEQGGGAVVNISSTIGRLRDRGFVAYGTAKSALTHMTRLMAADLAPKIRVNGIAVGSIATSALETVLTDDGLRNTMVSGTPLKRLGEPEDVANLILFLVDASWSMAVAERMAATKGAILSLLTDAYQRRDRVGLIVFQKSKATLVLPPLRSRRSSSSTTCAPSTASRPPRRPASSSGSMATSRAAKTGPASSSAVMRITETPVRSSPRRIALSTGDAPRRSGSSEKWTLSGATRARSSAACGSSRPKATTTIASGSASASGGTSGPSVSRSGRPSTRARAPTAFGRGSRWRPVGRGGEATTSTTSWTDATSASRVGTDQGSLPRNAMRMPGRIGGVSAPARHPDAGARSRAAGA